MGEDLYTEWLGVAAGDRPPDYYALLGLPALTWDLRAIEASARARLARLDKYSLHPDRQKRDAAQRMMTEVAQARVCLIHPERKAEYDKALSARLKLRGGEGPLRPGKAAASPQAGGAERLSAALDLPPAQRSRRISMAIACAVAILGLAIVLAVLLPARTRGRSQTPPGPLAESAQPATPATTRQAVGPMASPPAELAVASRPGEVQPQVNPPDRPADADGLEAQMSAAAQAVWDMLPQETRGAVLEVCRTANSRDPKAAAAAAAVKAVEDFYRDKTVTLPCRVKLSALPDGRCELTADFLAAANDHVNLRIRIRKTVTGQEASALEKLAGTAAPRLQITFSEAVNAWVRYGPQDASLTLEEVSNTPATSDRRRDLRFLGPDGSVLAGLDTQGQIAQAPEPAVVASQPEAPRQVEASKQPDVSRQPPTTAPSSLAANVADGGRQAEAEPAQDRRAVPEGVKSGEAARRDAEAGRRADEAARRDAEAARAPKAPKQAKVGKAPKAPAAPPAPPPPQPVRPGADLAVRADSRRGRPPASAPEAGDLDQREADAARGIWEMLPQDLRKRAADATAGNADPRKPPTPEMTAVYREIPGFYLGKTLTMPCQATLRTIGVRGDRGYFTAEMNADAGPQVRVQFRIHRICDAQEIESLTALAARKDLLLQVTPTRTVGASALACRLTRLNDQPGVILIEQWAGSQWPEEALILGPDGTILAGPRKGQKVAVPGARPAAVEPARTGK